MTEPTLADMFAGKGGFDPARAASFMLAFGHSGFLGMEYRAHGADWVELALPYKEEMIGDPATGVLASGPIVSLMDVATSLSIWTRIGSFHPQATMDLRVDYLRPARPGQTVVGRAECYHATHSIGFTRGMAHDGDPDDPLAHVAATFMRTESIF